MKIEILNSTGSKTGRNVELNDEIFGIEPNDHAIYLTVKLFLANQRQGTHKSKERNEVAGSTRKLHRQKEQVDHVKVISKIHCTMEAVLYSDLNQEIMVLS